MTQTITINPCVKEHVIAYKDGTTRTARLFKGVSYNPELICEYKYRSRRRGYPLDMTNIVSILPKEKKAQDKARKARKFLVKVAVALKKSGLWQDIRKDFEALILLDDATLEKFIYGPMDDAERKELATSIGLSDRMNLGFSDLADTINKGLKKINYSPYYAYESQFKNAIENHQDFDARWRKGYDNSISCKTIGGQNCAWYSEEYKNCGNGHYYLAINGTHAIFYEND